MYTIFLQSGLVWFPPPTPYLKILQDIHFPYVVSRSSEQPLESTSEITGTSDVEKEIGTEAKIVKKLQETLPSVHGQQ